jgi:hypothetical protein
MRFNMTKVLSQTGLAELIQLSKNEFLPKIGAVEATTVTLATVATSGDYDDLSNKPTVDQTYDGTSANAQSGVAIASVLGDIESAINTIRGV